jgi:DNA-directed RNA polymerase subunit M/transcription elongation factor TFIIS
MKCPKCGEESLFFYELNPPSKYPLDQDGKILYSNSFTTPTIHYVQCDHCGYYQDKIEIEHNFSCDRILLL